MANPQKLCFTLTHVFTHIACTDTLPLRTWVPWTPTLFWECRFTCLQAPVVGDVGSPALCVFALLHTIHWSTCQWGGIPQGYTAHSRCYTCLWQVGRPAGLQASLSVLQGRSYTWPEGSFQWCLTMYSLLLCYEGLSCHVTIFQFFVLLLYFFSSFSCLLVVIFNRCHHSYPPVPTQDSYGCPSPVYT